MIPEPCKYTPDVSFVNATFFNISAFVNSWKRCQPCFNGAQKRTAFREMADHFSSQNYKCCQKASFSLYWLAPGKTALCSAPSYVPLPADVSLQAGTQRETWSSQGCPGEGGGQSPAEPDVPPQPPWTARCGAGRAAGTDAPKDMVTTHCQEATRGMHPPSKGWVASKAHLSYRHW